MAITASTVSGGSLASGLAMGNVPAGKLGISVEMVPSPVLLAAQLDKLGLDIRSFREPLKRSVQKVMGPSFQHNFDVGGRPAWQELTEFTIERRAEAGYGPGPILVRSKLLRTVAGQLNIWTIDTEKAYVGGDLPRAQYGVVHQNGAEGLGRLGGPSSTGVGRQIVVTGAIPARPWALIQEEDVIKTELVFVAWFAERLALAGFNIGVL